MYISARERMILEILLAKSEEMTVRDLADEIDVSVRTIHRDLKGIEDILKDYGLSLVKKSGVGIQIIGDKAKIEELKFTLFNLSHNEYTPDERQTIIFCTLLESTEPVKLISLANDLNVTIATISNDLTKLEDRLRNYNLSLLRKRGYGVEIIGTETAKRKAMSSIIAENLNEVEFLSLVRENIQKKSTRQTDSISERLLGLVEKKKLLIVEKTIEEINEELPYSIADSAYIGLVVHLALAMERILQGENIHIDQAYLESLQAVPEYKIAEKIVHKLSKVFKVPIPVAEVGYITMHLQGAKLRHDKEYVIEDSSLKVAMNAKKLIRFVEDQLNVDLTSNVSLFQGLVAHLKPALYRIKQNMGITNPLLQKIKEDYADLFIIVKEGAEEVFPDLSVPDEEIGYLVMHFGSALLGIKKAEDLSALIICSSGIGTSKMLATRLQQELPEIKTFKNVSLFELNQVHIDDFDLVISTVNLPNFSREYIVVSPILTKEEIKKLRNYIRNHIYIEGMNRRASLMDHKFPDSRRVEKTIERMESIHQYSATISNVLKGFQVLPITSHQKVDQVLEEACQFLYKQGVIRDIELLIKALLEREKLGGLGIPNTKLVLYHSRSEYVVHPSFTILRLQKPLRVKAMDQSEMEAESILLLLSPQHLSSEGLEVLSFISALIIENEQSIELFESKNAYELSSYLAAKFEQFFDEKLKELRSV
ncbi:BglG family transcription antiterminator [Bacillus methanolicus]|uniref:Transcriptional regulator MtlR n=1 Tax=Bacillus methanolicus (strain MGA3 / ATCC 53907) TaxID=796606 RepID=I3E3X2_BACMM|nr:BglG family transcription antiterminator [Bacillus methanolicus]AIE58703.1 Transcriptional regulator MtlR [Bacillus methanolicus MGA3]EIJ81193.1 Transcriptional antiterminator of mannitol metabolism [Bacillus methanolicus MGA3]